MSSTDPVDFSDPSGAANFLQRYKHARSAISAPSTPRNVPQRTPATNPATTSNPAPAPAPASSSPTKSVWSSVFHPLGRSPTSAARYDLSPGQVSKPGYSASEIHSKGTGISLDELNNE